MPSSYVHRLLKVRRRTVARPRAEEMSSARDARDDAMTARSARNKPCCSDTPLLAAMQAVRVALPELQRPPYGFGQHRLTVWRKFDVAPLRAWQVLADWRAPYITASGTGAHAAHA
jgi:hypothetical protein